jgi:cathepsin A (carboxypeptidase C)
MQLKSIAIGNGLVSPLDTVYGYYETLCTTNPGVKEPVFNETRCDIIASNLPHCMAVVQTCYDHPDIAICEAANAVCRDRVIKWYDDEASFVGGRSRFDITASCKMNNFCYLEAALIQRYFNLNTTFAALGVPSSIEEFEIYSKSVSGAFDNTNDFEMSLTPQLQYLLANQVEILIYQGNLDLAGNTAAAKRWTARMPWKGQPAFTSQELQPWKSVVSGEEKVVGTFKEVWIQMVAGDEKRTRFSLVTINGAGHLVCGPL